jgi:hypothetical protein
MLEINWPPASFADIGGIVYHHGLNFLFTIYKYVYDNYKYPDTREIILQKQKQTNNNVEHPHPGLGQAEKCVRYKPINGIRITPS